LSIGNSLEEELRNYKSIIIIVVTLYYHCYCKYYFYVVCLEVKRICEELQEFQEHRNVWNGP